MLHQGEHVKEIAQQSNEKGKPTVSSSKVLTPKFGIADFERLRNVDNGAIANLEKNINKPISQLSRKCTKLVNDLASAAGLSRILSLPNNLRIDLPPKLNTEAAGLLAKMRVLCSYREARSFFSYLLPRAETYQLGNTKGRIGQIPRMHYKRTQRKP